MKARILGVTAQMGKFDFYFGVSLGELIFQHCDNLSQTLQIGDISAAEGQPNSCHNAQDSCGLAI